MAASPAPSADDVMADVAARAVRDLVAAAPAAVELGEVFAAAGHELALVGGPVRDAFLGRLAGLPDLDFATSARPEATEAILARWGEACWDVGRAYGTIGARRGGTVVEVTTYRADRYEHSSRRPEVVFGDDLVGDLHRRDLTVNAMALRLPSRELVDPYGGLHDLMAQVLRTPAPPEQSFDEDPLRVLRAARFASQLRMGPDEATRAAMAAAAPRIDPAAGVVAAERTGAEVVKLVMGEAPRAGLEVLVDTGVADHVLPELSALRATVDEHGRHKDVYDHTLTVLEQAIALEERYTSGPDLVLRLAAVMHDVGKPATRRFERGGAVSFHHHEVVGAKMTARRLRELRLDKATVRDVSRLVGLHLRFHGYGGGEWTDSAVRRYVTDAGDLLPRLHALTRADSTTRNRRRAAALDATYDDLEERIDRLTAAEELGRVRPELDGAQIMEVLGIAPGPLVGRAYAHLLTVRLDAGLLGEAAARAELLEWWARQPGAGDGPGPAPAGPAAPSGSAAPSRPDA